MLPPWPAGRAASGAGRPSCGPLRESWTRPGPRPVPFHREMASHLPDSETTTRDRSPRPGGARPPVPMSENQDLTAIGWPPDRLHRAGPRPRDEPTRGRPELREGEGGRDPGEPARARRRPPGVRGRRRQPLRSAPVLPTAGGLRLPARGRPEPGARREAGRRSRAAPREDPDAEAAGLRGPARPGDAPERRGTRDRLLRPPAARGDPRMPDARLHRPAREPGLPRGWARPGRGASPLTP